MDIASGDVLVALNSKAPASEKAPAWIKITPRGKTVTRNGPEYTFEPEALAARFKEDQVAIAIDLDHAIVKLGTTAQKAEAIGWVEELDARPDGLYGRVDWLTAGKAALSARTHRYISPTFYHEEGKATWLHSVALVTSPALRGMPALAHAPASKAPLRAALGLDASADDAAMLAAIDALKAKAGGMAVADSAVQSLALELNQERRAAHEKRIEAKIKQAMLGGYLVPAMKDWATLSCNTNEAVFDQFLEKVGPVFAHLMKRDPTIEKTERAMLSAGTDRPLRSEEAGVIAAQLGIDPKSLG